MKVRIVVATIGLLGSAISVLRAQNFWEPTSLGGMSITAAAINRSNGYLFAGPGDSGMYRSTDQGFTWGVVNEGLTDHDLLSLAISASATGQYLFAGTVGVPGNGIYRSTDNGTTWSGIRSGFVSSFTANFLGPVFAGTLEEGILRSTDNGQTWNIINNGLTTLDIRSLAVDSSSSIFAGTYGRGVFRSTNNGGSWVQVDSGLTNNRIFALALNGTNHVFAGSLGGGVFHSTDSGESWSPVNTGLSNLFVITLAVNSLGHIFAGTTAGGAFRSLDDGDHWGQINGGLNSSMVRTLAIDQNGFVFAGTPNGLFRSILSTTSTDVVNGELPAHFSLAQNYPNPFNPSTKITYELPRQVKTTLKVYNALAQEVATLVDAEQSAGRYEVEFSGQGLASGVYFYRLQARHKDGQRIDLSSGQTGEFVETRKLVLIK